MKQFLRLLVAVSLALCVVLPLNAGSKTKDSGKEKGTAVTPMPVPARPSGMIPIFQEGFNDTTSTPPGFPPVGWTILNEDGDPPNDGWYQSLTVGGTGGPGPIEGIAFAADWYGTANGFYIDDYFITPNTGGSAPPGSVDSLTFWVSSRLSPSGNYPDSLDIRLSSTGTVASDFTTRLAYILAPKATWQRLAFAIPITPNRYIAFRYLMYDGGPSGANSDKVCVDDVQINRYPSTGVGDGTETPLTSALKQNYPNPFNPTTQIDFQLQSSAFTTLRVYDMLGREVGSLVNEQLAAGRHNRTFDASGLSSGIYLYRMTAGGFTATRQMIIMK